jgi:hypothetical protein
MWWKKKRKVSEAPDLQEFKDLVKMAADQNIMVFDHAAGNRLSTHLIVLMDLVYYRNWGEHLSTIFLAHDLWPSELEGDDNTCDDDDIDEIFNVRLIKSPEFVKDSYLNAYYEHDLDCGYPCGHRRLVLTLSNKNRPLIGAV